MNFRIFFYFYILLFLDFLNLKEILAQCSFGGTPLYKGCLGVTWEGCCTIKKSAAGIEVTTLQWCENGYLCSYTCNILLDAPYCGWVTDPNTGQGMYDCTTAPASDPTGKFPYLCQIPCGNVSYVGCCEGQTLLKYCKDGSLNLINCAYNTDSTYKYCGWDPSLQVYTCTLAPIEGPSQYPYSCDSSCVPNCKGKECGSDGCGGICGVCGAGLNCNTEGKCVKGECIPNCSGKMCGDDGCGGSCGNCGDNGTCIGGVCSCTYLSCGNTCCAIGENCYEGKCCKPDCKNKECGSDGCGGFCGVCFPPYVCSENFKCIKEKVEENLKFEVIEDVGVEYTNWILCPDGTYTFSGFCPNSQENTKMNHSSNGCCFNTSNFLNWKTFLLIMLIYIFNFIFIRLKNENKTY